MWPPTSQLRNAGGAIQPAQTRSKRNVQPGSPKDTCCFPTWDAFFVPLPKIRLAGTTPIAGVSNAALVERKYGKSTYQQARNNWHQNARDGMIIELGKYGLGPRDLHATLNFFSKVTVDNEGCLHFSANHSRPGSYVELRAEMNVLVLLNTCPHPLDAGDIFAAERVELSISRVPAPRSDDPCRMFCPENVRGFLMTEFYFL